MKSEVIAGRYTDALLAAAVQQRAAEAVLEQIKWYQKTVAASLSPLLENPMIPNGKKERFIARLFMVEGAGSPVPAQGGDARGADSLRPPANAVWSVGAKLLFHFVRLLIRKGRVGYLSDIFRLYPKRYEAEMGIVKGMLYLAYPISSDLVDRLRGKIEAKVHRRVTFDTIQDSQILGGFIFATGTVLIDASIRRILIDLKERLKTVPVG